MPRVVTTMEKKMKTVKLGVILQESEECRINFSVRNFHIFTFYSSMGKYERSIILFTKVVGVKECHIIDLLLLFALSKPLLNAILLSCLPCSFL